jgi:hypothetical protein
MITAVDWLINEWMHLDAEFDLVLIDKNTYWKKLKEKHNQAKEMEKEQINKACYDGYYQEEMMNTKEYYDKTFNSKIIQNKFGKLK